MREITFVTSYLHSYTSVPFWKGVCSKSKEFAPLGSKFFPIRVDPFSEGSQNNFVRVISPESVSIPLNVTSTVTGNLGNDFQFICNKAIQMYR